MTITIENLQEHFKVQIERGVTNLFFYTMEDGLDWRPRAFPVSDLTDLLPYLEQYRFHSITTHLPRYCKV